MFQYLLLPNKFSTAKDIHGWLSIFSRLFLFKKKKITDSPTDKPAGMGDKSSIDLRLSDMETITNDFSKDQKVGSGGYGDVYRV